MHEYSSVQVYIGQYLYNRAQIDGAFLVREKHPKTKIQNLIQNSFLAFVLGISYICVTEV
jgi:hypothetical protein